MVFCGLQDMVISITKKHPTDFQSSHKGAVLLPLRITGLRVSLFVTINFCGGIILYLVWGGHKSVGDGTVLCTVGYLASEPLVDANSAPSSPPVRTTKNISRHCLSPPGGHIHPQWRTLNWTKICFNGKLGKKLFPGRSHETNFTIKSDLMEAFVKDLGTVYK